MAELGRYQALVTEYSVRWVTKGSRRPLFARERAEGDGVEDGTVTATADMRGTGGAQGQWATRWSFGHPAREALKRWTRNRNRKIPPRCRR
jgi:hypothetical protein